MKVSSSRKWFCVYCSADVHLEHCFLKQEIWNKIHNSCFGMVCLSCMEQRLGRLLNKDDFTDCYINRLNYGSKSARLVDRLTREAGKT